VDAPRHSHSVLTRPGELNTLEAVSRLSITCAAERETKRSSPTVLDGLAARVEADDLDAGVGDPAGQPGRLARHR